jgi:Protein kinase domain
MDFIKKYPDDPVPLAQMMRYGLDILSALRYLHSLSPPILHRDLKSANVLFTDPTRQNVQVCDFGLAATTTTILTMTHKASVGTAGYLSFSYPFFSCVVSYCLCNDKVPVSRGERRGRVHCKERHLLLRCRLAGDHQLAKLQVCIEQQHAVEYDSDRSGSRPGTETH